MKRYRDLGLFSKIFVPVLGGYVLLALFLWLKMLPDIEEGLMNEKKTRLQNVVELAVSTMNGYNNLAKSGEISQETAQAKVKEIIKKMRFDEKNYIFVFNKKMMLIQPVSPKREGKLLSFFKDDNDKLYLQEASNICQTDKECFINYYKAKPNTDIPIPKISYIKLFEPWGWMIGTGIYYDDIEEQLSVIKTSLFVSFLIFTLILLFVIGFLISRYISAPVKRLNQIARDVKTGNLSAEYYIENHDEIGRLGEVFIDMKNVISSLLSELKNLNDKTIEGKLDFRANAAVFEGAYKGIIEGVNTTLDSIIKPLNVTAEYVDRIAKGDIPPKISEEYKGDFNEIKNNLNMCIDAVNLLVQDSASLSDSAAAGQLNARVDVSRHGGDFAKIISGVNSALDNISEPVKITADYIEKIACGNIPPIITKEFKGDFNAVKNNLNKCIDSVSLLIQDTTLLSHAAAEGKLDFRVDASRHGGDFAEIIKGINNSLDSVIGPLNISAEYIAKIALGVLPQRIEKEFAGDFNSIRININTMIDTIKTLGTELGTVIRSQKAGDLDARTNPNTLKGEYSELLKGINETIDAIVQPILETSLLMREYAAGNLKNSLRELPGKQITLTKSVNTVRNNIYNLIEDTNYLMDAASAGNLSVRADHTIHQGVYSDIIKDFNATLDNIIKPLNMAADYIDSIAQGKIPEKIKEDYKGDFNSLKGNLNACIDTMNGLLTETSALILAAKAGDLNKKGNYNNFTGSWSRLISDINELIDSIALPVTEVKTVLERISENDYTMKMEGDHKGIWLELKIATNNSMSRLEIVQEVLSKVSQGDLSEYERLVSIGKRSENDKLIPSFILMMESVKLLVSDINILSNSIIEGNTIVRANTLNHKGEFKSAFEGINSLLDAVIAPVNECIVFLEQLNLGVNIQDADLSAFKGDYKKIALNINKLKNFIGLLISDTSATSEAAVIGDMSKRIDESKYPGNWKNIALGFNNTIDAVAEPLGIAIEFMDKMSKGATFRDLNTADFKGEYRRFVNDINILRAFLNDMINDTNQTAMSAVEGKLNSRINSSKYPGDWQIITNGFNETLDAIMAPIDEAGKVIQIMSTGNLTARVNGNYKGDHKILKDSINQLGKSLSSLIEQALEGVDTTASATFQISAAAESIASSAHEQSAQTEEIAGAVEEMSKTITQNAHNALSGSDMAKKNGDIAKEGGAVVEQTLKKMRDIAEFVNESAVNITKLGQSGQAIGEIISVIDDIADQTNLLALNAAIEAARAGEQGRGFAVVADEVRKLAERTTNATKQIASMINGIQIETKKAVDGMQKGNKEVIEGIALADKAGNALKEIVISSQEVLNMISHIATSNEEQAATSEQLTKNVTVVSQVTNGTAMRIQEIAQSSEDLSKLTEQLKSLMNTFKVHEIDLNSNENIGYSSKKHSIGVPNYLADHNSAKFDF